MALLKDALVTAAVRVSVCVVFLGTEADAGLRVTEYGKNAVAVTECCIRGLPGPEACRPSFEEIKKVAVAELPMQRKVGSEVAVATTVADGSIAPNERTLPVVLEKLQLFLDRTAASTDTVVAPAAPPSGI